VNALERFRHDITVQLLERASDAWAADCLHLAERLAASAWTLVGEDGFIDRDEPKDVDR
jgi:hypothetical protein